MKITLRDCVVAAIAVVFTLAGVRLSNSPTRASAAQDKIPPAMTSSVFDWNKMESRPTEVGAVRQVFQNPTPTLDELECHITTLNPGAIPHEPHKHVDEELILVKEGTVESLVNGEKRRAGFSHLSIVESIARHPQCRRHARDVFRREVELAGHDAAIN